MNTTFKSNNYIGVIQSQILRVYHSGIIVYNFFLSLRMNNFYLILDEMAFCQ